MPRATAEEVANILQVDPALWDDIYLTLATKLIDNVLSCAQAKGITLDDATLLCMEQLVAAHLYSQNDRQSQATSKRELDASISWSEASGKGSSTWLDSAKAFDPSGCLAEMFDNQTVNNVQVFHAGLPYDEPYEE